MSFADTLIAWYQDQGRDLPWRHTTDPYRIWLSEIILQQTRVEQGRGYYLRFLEEYPTVQALADAPEEQVLKTWQGLGYYSRARNLHRAARLIAGPLQGQFPATLEGLLALPGVGRYTAAAIASFAFRQAVPVIDGNVYRVVARRFGIATPVPSDAAYREFEALLLNQIDPHRPDLFNQAMMDFGALICTPLSPHCADCPLAPHCHALRHGSQSLLPVRQAKRQPQEVWFYYIHMANSTHLLLHPRTAPGPWRGLYELPLIESPHPLTGEELRARLIPLGIPLTAPLAEPPVEMLHRLTHRTIHATFLRPILPEGALPAPSSEQAYTHHEAKKLPVSRLIDRYLSPRM